MAAFQCLILGAAGRDFHDFQTFFRRQPQFRVRAFTATQIPFIDARFFPRELAGPDYDQDIPIYDEAELPRLIRELNIDFVFLAYSDLSHEQVMHKASLIQSCGAAFVLLGPRQTQLQCDRPVIAVTAVRTGAGKSPISQCLARHLTHAGKKVAVIRHPMPYGDLRRQAVQRLASWEDLQTSQCTVEEQEEYLPYIEQGQVVFAGVDYRHIMAATTTTLFSLPMCGSWLPTPCGPAMKPGTTPARPISARRIWL
jgi:predicted GTPase